ncbi:hypothetical protein ACRE_012190 [Hapsidospora chrysogenum ATCC 11550]|uniref:Uncharacterized protein n=1 Tax=Hapsidospora chrysogenum (strain ATCC 11550 / CBS 779.69 / DSM 880 / IAM 14645 / JCM 23072 / IMI 49137) TaxID=857340 RepID=A0A086TF20_HAPC1|nr:hypothetical protein ACRE_012190 [Hapsidospora chrysogenum ATCC 11550]
MVGNPERRVDDDDDDGVVVGGSSDRKARQERGNREGYSLKLKLARDDLRRPATDTNPMAGPFGAGEI